MTVPKPKVALHVYGLSRDFMWSCGCGDAKWADSLDRAIDAATAHSRTHTAERITEFLDERSKKDGKWFVKSGEPADLMSSLAYSSAADLIRKYLT